MLLRWGTGARREERSLTIPHTCVTFRSNSLLSAAILLLHVSTFSSVFRTAVANPDAKRLYDDLMSSYNRLIRPVGNNSDRLTVKMGLKLSQLIEVVCTRSPWLLVTMCRDSL